MLVIGEKEMNEGKVSVRRQGKGDLGMIDTDEFTKNILEEIRSRHSE